MKTKTPNNSSLLERRGIINEIQLIYFHLNLDKSNFEIKPSTSKILNVDP